VLDASDKAAVKALAASVGAVDVVFNGAGYVHSGTILECDEADAADYIAGYCVVHDVSERSFQLERGGQWDKGKGCDTFGPIGPYWVTADAVKNPLDLDIWLSVNGKMYQQSNTKNRVFGPVKLVPLSQFMSLQPGGLSLPAPRPGLA